VTRRDGSCFKAEYARGSLVREVVGSSATEEAGDDEDVCVVQVAADSIGDGFRRAEQCGEVIDLLD
jgi:hypothetical protein